MSKFIRLTNFLFNTNDIHKIIISPNKYYIHIVNKQIRGFNVTFGGFGSGYIYSHTDIIEVCKDEHNTDYNIVSNWINKN
jgi:hypothetical protein